MLKGTDRTEALTGPQERLRRAPLHLANARGWIGCKAKKRTHRLLLFRELESRRIRWGAATQ